VLENLFSLQKIWLFFFTCIHLMTCIWTMLNLKGAGLYIEALEKGDLKKRFDRDWYQWILGNLHYLNLLRDHNNDHSRLRRHSSNDRKWGQKHLTNVFYNDSRILRHLAVLNHKLASQRSEEGTQIQWYPRGKRERNHEFHQRYRFTVWGRHAWLLLRCSDRILEKQNWVLNCQRV